MAQKRGQLAMTMKTLSRCEKRYSTQQSPPSEPKKRATWASKCERSFIRHGIGEWVPAACRSREQLFLVPLLLLALSLAACAQEHPKWPPSSYAVYYGKWNPETVGKARGYDLLIIHAGEDFENLDRALVQNLQQGADGKSGTSDDAVVCVYVSIGETSDSPGGPPRASDLNLPGPVYQGADQNLVWMKRDFPTRFLDELAYELNDDGFFKMGPDGKKVIKPGHDGLPDMNGIWGSYFVYAADEAWRRETLEKMSRLKETLGADGFFLDTVDTASKWGKYGYSQKAMAEFVAEIRSRFPDQFLIANRGISLLESHPDLYRSSIDALMFEGFATEWDWDGERGHQSPWLGGHQWALENVVGPQAAKEDGFVVLVLDYLTLDQPELAPLFHTQQELYGGFPHLFYLAHPSLDRFYPSPDSYFPPSGGGRTLPKVTAFSVVPNGLNGFKAELSTDADLPDFAAVDLRYRPDGDTTPKTQALKSWPLDWKAPRRTGNRWTLEGSGLEAGNRYTFYARLVGPATDLRGSYLQDTLAVPDHPAPAPEEVSAESRESGLEVSWTAEPGKRYQIFTGQDLDSLKPAGTFESSPAKLTGLKNGTAYLVSVATLDDQGRAGPVSMPVRQYAMDCTPPAAPAGLQATLEDGALRLKWAPVSGAERYYLYFRRQGGPFRLPLQANEPTALVTKAAPGKYQIVVTALDGEGNESGPSSPVTWDRGTDISAEESGTGGLDFTGGVGY